MSSSGTLVRDALAPVAGRVLQICHGYSGPFGDVARQYVDALGRLGYEVDTVYLTGAPSEEVVRLTGGATVSFLGQQSDDIGGLKSGAIRAVARLCARADYAFCVTHRFKPAFVACLATSLPVLAVFHAYGTFARRTRQWFARLFKKRLLLVAVSDAVRDDIRACLRGRGPRVETLHNHIDAERGALCLLDRAAARQQLGLGEDDFVVANVGRLHPDKDQATLLRAYAAVRERLPQPARLLVVGAGRLAETLHDQARALGLGAEEVIWLERLPDARRYFAAFDVFALPSDHEPFGMVVLEAMLAGVPVAATRAGGVPEILGEHHPYLFPVGDAGALAEALTGMAALAPAARSALLADARARLLDGFSSAAAARRLGGLISELPGSVRRHVI